VDFEGKILFAKTIDGLKNIEINDCFEETCENGRYIETVIN